MDTILRFVGPERAVELFGIRLIGVDAETDAKLVVILRGGVFDVGDRIVTGGVRGDVIGLTFTERGVRDVKDAMSRGILAGLDGAGIAIASASVAISALPELRIRRAAAPRGAGRGRQWT